MVLHGLLKGPPYGCTAKLPCAAERPLGFSQYQ